MGARHSGPRGIGERVRPAFAPGARRRRRDFSTTAGNGSYAGINIIDHIVMGSCSCANGLPENPRAYRWVGNQAPDQHMPSPIVVMSAIGS